MSDIQPGDVVVCISLPMMTNPTGTMPRIGALYRVTEVTCRGAGINLAGMSAGRFAAYGIRRFRKIRPADPEFIAQIRRVKQPA